MEVLHLGQSNAAGAGVDGLDNSPAIALLSALSAHAVNLKSVAGRQIVMLAPNFLFQFPDFR